MSRVTCQMSHFSLFFFLFSTFLYTVVGLVGGRSLMNGATPTSLHLLYIDSHNVLYSFIKMCSPQWYMQLQPESVLESWFACVVTGAVGGQ